jgi:hypothetical protein
MSRIQVVVFWRGGVRHWHQGDRLSEVPDVPGRAGLLRERRVGAPVRHVDGYQRRLRGLFLVEHVADRVASL